MFWANAEESSPFRREHGYVLLTILLSWFLHNMVFSFYVMAARKKYGVSYPTLYLSGDDKNSQNYNCVQRAHANTLENLPSFLSLFVPAGMFYPVSASLAGLVYLFGAWRYFSGYATGDPKKRMKGAIKYIGLFALVGMNVKAALELLGVYPFV